MNLKAMRLRFSRPTLALGASGIAVMGAVLAPMGAIAQKPKKALPVAPPSFEKDVAPLVGKYCTSCHSSADSPGGVILPKGLTATAALKKQGMWSKVAKNVANLHMPPQGMPAPSKAERARLVAWVDGAFQEECDLADPGRVTIRRLNRSEYNYTVQDLLGVDATHADDFPSDDVGYGFDNIGDVLSVSPLLMEKYMAAAEKLSKSAIRVPKLRTHEVPGSEFEITDGANADGAGLFFFSSGTGTAKVKLRHAGMYNLRWKMGQQAAGPETAQIEVSVDGTPLAKFDVIAPATKPEWYELPLNLEAGEHKIGVKFLNDYYKAAENGQPQQDRNVLVPLFEAVGPKEGTIPLPKIHAAILPTKPAKEAEDAAAKTALGKFATKAYRRPVTSEETDRLMGVYRMVRRTGEPFERAIQVGVQAVLASPSFLFRVELDPKPTDPKAKRLVNGHELASRLSYFLWSSMPDERLTNLAKSGELGKAEVLDSEVTRMLKDPRATRLTENFAMQWLELRKLATFEPDKERFPNFTEELREDMIAETSAYFDFVRAQDRPILDFLDSKYVFVNARLAKLYGIPNVKGEALQRVATDDPRRGGLLTQASVLTVSSNPTRTSPTKRGKWILEEILGSPPPPPPPGVGQLKDEKRFTDAMTLRQRMEEHRKDPSCASCHRRMDALGFGFENYDPIGAWRTKDGKFAVDASGTLPNGKSFTKPDQLKTILMGQKATFARTFAEKMLTFALGRGMEEADDCFLDAIAANAAKNGYKFSSIVREVVRSDPFRKRRGDGTPAKP